MISVTVETPRQELVPLWESLGAHATNAFLHPAALMAAMAALQADIVLLLAWDLSHHPAQLVGWWALERKSLMLLRYLRSPPFDYAFLSTPIADPAKAPAVVAAFLSAIAGDRRLSPAILLKDCDADGPVGTALAGSTVRRRELQRDERPFVTKESGLKRSGSTRKKLRQEWNRLAATGHLEVRTAHAGADLDAAIETFLQLEADSWKGEGGTALLSKPAHAEFARTFVRGMAAAGRASVALLCLDNRPIAAQVLLQSGRTAYTWKTSFDQAFARFSPGALLVDRLSVDLIDAGVADAIDSCSIGTGFMASLWSGRKPMLDAVVSVGGRGTVTFFALTGFLVARRHLKSARDRIVGWWGQRDRSMARPADRVSPAAQPAADPDASPPEASGQGPTARHAA